MIRCATVLFGAGISMTWGVTAKGFSVDWNNEEDKTC